MGVVSFNYLDTMLIPLTLLIAIGYHAFLWRKFRKSPSLTTIGINTVLGRKEWLQGIKQGDGKKEMLAVQSLRNALMATILTATITIIVTLSMAALASSTYNATTSFVSLSPIFVPQSGSLIAFKYGSISVFLLFSFLCSSLAVGFFVDANFLINASAEIPSRDHVGRILEQGFLLAVAGNRLLCIAFPLILWLLGPVQAAVSSAVVVFGLYHLDFPNKEIEKRT
ncbi:hypothetical protein Droror1_Dr00009029 [Drosera rotundifolia]